MEGIIDGPYRTFTEETAGELFGKEGYLVECTGSGTAQLLNAGLAVGIVHLRPQVPLTTKADVSIRLLGKGGTVKVVQNGAIVPGTRAKGAAGGKCTALGASGRSIGIKLRPASNGANGDLAEFADVVETIA